MTVSCRASRSIVVYLTVLATWLSSLPRFVCACPSSSERTGAQSRLASPHCCCCNQAGTDQLAPRLLASSPSSTDETNPVTCQRCCAGSNQTDAQPHDSAPRSPVCFTIVIPSDLVTSKAESPDCCQSVWYWSDDCAFASSCSLPFGSILASNSDVNSPDRIKLLCCLRL